MAVERSLTITSTFERVSGSPSTAVAFDGEHVRGEFRVARTYGVARGTEVLQEDTRYYVDERLVRERTSRWIVDRRSGTVGRSDRSIEAFCRDRHMTDPRADVDSFLD